MGFQSSQQEGQRVNAANGRGIRLTLLTEVSFERRVRAAGILNDTLTSRKVQ